MKLLQLPTLELEQRIKEEIEKNPALEEGMERDNSERDEYDDYSDDSRSEAEKEFDFSDYMDDDTPSYKLNTRNKGRDDEDKSMPIVLGTSFHEYLENQIGLRKLSPKQELIARHIIGSLDESGYLRRELEAVADDLAFSQNISVSKDDVEEVLEEIQQLDPAGVGARDLRECLLLQLKRKKGNYVTKTAIHILENYFEEFTKKHYEKILKKTELDSDDLKEAMDEILKLNPKPGGSVNETTKSAQPIIPDFTVNIVDGELELKLNGRNVPQLKVSRTYKDMIEGYVKSKDSKVARSDKDTLQFVKQKLDSAKWFIDAIKQRQETLMNTMSAIMERQREFFLEGDEIFLKPMILKDIAEMVHLDISTISRVVNSKYVETPYGTFLLKDFFSESISTSSGEEVSNKEVKKILQNIIGEEDKAKPVTDDKLSEILKDKGYNIARRTVAKYREQLNIPVARLRKEL